MLRFFQALMPREEKFFALFNDHARTLVDGAVALRDLLEGGPGVTDACRRIVAHENQADAIAVTPWVAATSSSGHRRHHAGDHRRCGRACAC